MIATLARILRRVALCLSLAAAGSAQTRVAWLGDSITEGARLVAPGQHAPPAQLAVALGADFDVSGFGAGGHTLRASADRPYAASPAFRQALEFAPDVAIVMLGTNDTVLSEARPNWLPEHDMTPDVMALVAPLRKANAKVRVLLASPPTMLAQAPDLTAPRRADLVARTPRIRALTQHLREVAEGLEGVEFVDLTRTLRERHVTDGVHPNAYGAQRIAWRLAGAVRFVDAPGPGPIERLQAMGITERLSRFHGFRRVDFHLVDRDAAQLETPGVTLVAPDRVAAGAPWIWRARFFGHEPALDLALLDRGFHLGYVDVAGLFGARRAVARMARFQDVCDSVGLGPKPILEGMSRGGLAILEYAKVNPKRVGALYGDNPVCDFRSWPGGRSGKRSDADWRACLGAWQLDEEAAWSFEGGPLAGLEPLAAAGVPLQLVLGMADRVVPPLENGERLAAAYAAAGGEVEVWRKPGLGHHPHGLDPVDPLLRALLREAGPAWEDLEASPSVLAAPSVAFRGQSAGWGGGTWSHAFEALEALSREARSGEPYDVVFFGDSITQGLTGHTDRLAHPDGARPFDRFHGARRAVSLGLSGDRTEHLLYRLQRGSLDGFRPRVVVLQIGVNNVNAAGHTGAETFAGIVRVVDGLQERLPDTRVLIAGPFPAGNDPQSGLRQSVADVHERLAAHEFGSRVAYVSLWSHFVDEDGLLRPTMSRDGIHITGEGQEAWMSSIAPRLDAWLDGR